MSRKSAQQLRVVCCPNGHTSIRNAVLYVITVLLETRVSNTLWHGGHNLSALRLLRSGNRLHLHSDRWAALLFRKKMPAKLYNLAQTHNIRFQTFQGRPPLSGVHREMTFCRCVMRGLLRQGFYPFIFIFSPPTRDRRVSSEVDF